VPARPRDPRRRARPPPRVAQGPHWVVPRARRRVRPGRRAVRRRPPRPPRIRPRPPPRPLLPPRVAGRVSSASHPARADPHSVSSWAKREPRTHGEGRHEEIVPHPPRGASDGAAAQVLAAAPLRFGAASRMCAMHGRDVPRPPLRRIVRRIERLLGLRAAVRGPRPGREKRYGQGGRRGHRPIRRAVYCSCAPPAASGAELMRLK